MKGRKAILNGVVWFCLGWIGWYGSVFAASPSLLPSLSAESSPRPPPAKQVPLNLEESIQIALQNNLDIRVESFSPLIQSTEIGIAKSVFDPNFFLRSRLAREREGEDAPQNFPNEGVSDDKIFEVEGGVEQLLPTGGRYTLSLQEERLDSNEIGAGRTINPTHDQSLRLSFTQSLLRNLGIGVNRTDIRIAQNNQQISESEFRQQVINIIAQVQQVYWELVSRIEELEVEQQQLQLARDLLQKTRIQVEVGTLASLDVLQAEAEVAAIEDRVIVAQNAIATVNDRLKEILNFPQTVSEWEMVIIPTDEPAFVVQEIDLEEAITAAFTYRPDYAQAKLDIENRNLTLRFRKNQLYPVLDVNGSLGLNNRLEKDFSDAFDSTASGEFLSWEVGLRLLVPLGNREARNRWIRAKLEVEQALAALKRLEQQIIREVRETVRDVRTNDKRVSATRVARELAEKQLAAEEKKLDVGLSTVRNVLELQRDLAVARRNEIQAIIAYTISLTNLVQVQGVTLERHNLEIDLPNPASTTGNKKKGKTNGKAEKASRP